MRTFLAATAICCADIAAAQDDAAQMAFNNHCRTCHSLDAGDNRLGPSLHGVAGREAGTLEGYAFSQAMARSTVTWDAASLDAFIEDPDAVVPGHGMSPYQGIPDPEIRARILDALGAG